MATETAAPLRADDVPAGTVPLVAIRSLSKYYVRGELRIAGVDIVSLADADLAAWRATNVGFIFQFYNLMPVLTAYQNIELPLMLTSLSRSERRERVETALALVSLSDRQDHYPGEL